MLHHPIWLALACTLLAISKVPDLAHIRWHESRDTIKAYQSDVCQGWCMLILQVYCSQMSNLGNFRCTERTSTTNLERSHCLPYVCTNMMIYGKLGGYRSKGKYVRAQMWHNSCRTFSENRCPSLTCLVLPEFLQWFLNGCGFLWQQSLKLRSLMLTCAIPLFGMIHNDAQVITGRGVSVWSQMIFDEHVASTRWSFHSLSLMNMTLSIYSSAVAAQERKFGKRITVIKSWWPQGNSS